MMDVLYENKISVEYMYAFASASVDMAYVILRVADNDKAEEALLSGNVKLLTSEEVKNLK